MPRSMKVGTRLQALAEWVETKTGRSRLEVQRIELRKLIRIAEAAAALEPRGWNGMLLAAETRAKFSRLADALDALEKR